MQSFLGGWHGFFSIDMIAEVLFEILTSISEPCTQWISYDAMDDRTKRECLSTVFAVAFGLKKISVLNLGHFAMANKLSHEAIIQVYLPCQTFDTEKIF